MKKNLLADILLLAAAAVLVWFDRFTKYLVISKLGNGGEIVVWDGVFKIVLHTNTGAVWGIMSGKTAFLIVITIVILAVIFYMFFRTKWEYARLRALKVIYAFIIAGAVGNLIDRIGKRGVTDFLYFELIDFPVFNVADCYITVSMIVLLVLVIFYYKEEDFDLIWRKRSQSTATDSPTDSE